MSYHTSKSHYAPLKANTVRIIERYNRALAMANSSSSRFSAQPTSMWFRFVLYLFELGITWLFLFLLVRSPTKELWETLAWSLCFAFFFVGTGWAIVRKHNDSPCNIVSDPELAAISAASNGATEPISLVPLAGDDCETMLERVLRDVPTKYGRFDEEQAIIALIAHLQIESILARDRTV